MGDVWEDCRAGTGAGVEVDAGSVAAALGGVCTFAGPGAGIDPEGTA